MDEIIKYFIENPYEEIYLRELSRLLSLSTSLTKKYLDLHLKNNLLKETKRGNLRYFKANVDNLQFKYSKIAYNIKILQDFRIVEQILDKKSMVSTIMVYGSFAKGKNEKKSDLDILIIGSKENIALKFPTEVSIQTFSHAEWKKQKESNLAFYQDVITQGIVIRGEVPVI